MDVPWFGWRIPTDDTFGIHRGLHPCPLSGRSDCWIGTTTAAGLWAPRAAVFH